MKTMPSRYVEFPEKGCVAIRSEEVATDNLGPCEVVLQTETSLISAGTELSRLNGLEPGSNFPVRPGYACIGRILAKGASVNDYDVGQRVFYAGHHAAVQRFLHGQDHQWGRLYPVAEDLASEDAVFVCLAQIAAVGPAVTELRLGTTVAVFGLGLIGNLAAQLYQRAGARVIALDPEPRRCELGRACGLDAVVDAAPGEQVARVRAMTGGRGADVTVDAVGHSAVVMSCIEAAGLMGQVVLLGTPRAKHEGNLTAAFHRIHMEGLVLRGAHMWRFPAVDMRGAGVSVASLYRSVFELMRRGELKIGPLRSHLASPDEAPALYRGLEAERDRYWGVVFDWRR